MKPLHIAGIGILSARGRGLGKFEQALTEGWVPPAVSKDGRMAYRIATEDLTDKEVLSKARRADRFSKLTVLAAHDALKDSGLSPEELCKSTGIIIATAFGAHSSIFKFLDGIIDYGETKVSPTTFAHSIHNAAAAYVASTLDCKGPAMTVTQFHFAFHQALLLAYAWLIERRVDQVLVGIADECSPAMEYICQEKLAPAAGGKMKPLAFSSKPGAVPGEGSVFFLVSLDPSKSRYGAFENVTLGEIPPGRPDLTVLSGNGMAGSEAVCREVLAEGSEIAAYSPIYGGLMSSGGFEAAAAALMLKNQVKYGSPVFDKIQGFKVVEKTVPGPVRSVRCISHDCEGQTAFLQLVK